MDTYVFEGKRNGERVKLLMEIVADGYLLKADSVITSRLSNTAKNGKNDAIANRRRENQDKVRNNTLLEDIWFKSISGAASFGAGHPTNGNVLWGIGETAPVKAAVKPKPKPTADIQQPTYQPAAYSNDKDKLLYLYGAGCQGCGRVFADPDYLEVDHDQPRSLGGDNAFNNLQLLCTPCNRLKGNIFTRSGLRKELRKIGKKRYITERGLMDFRGIAAET